MKALDTQKKTEYKPFTELIMVRIVKNNAKDTVKAWRYRIGRIFGKVFGPKSS